MGIGDPGRKKLKNFTFYFAASILIYSHFDAVNSAEKA
jgi:hypothetical protein